MLNSDDTRNSPSQVVEKKLLAEGAEVIIHDPYVKEYQGDVYTKAEGCDAVAVMVAHRMYKLLDPGRLKSALKTR